MAIITMPLTVKLGAECGWSQITYESANQGGNGAMQVMLGGEPRWRFDLVQPSVLTRAEAGALRGVLLQLRGAVNVLATWDPLRASPLGTLSGSPTASIAAGSNQLSLSGSGTVFAGTLLQVGTGYGTSQVFEVVSDGAAGGTVTVEPPARRTYSGAAVTYTRPLSYFRRSPGEPLTWRGAGTSGLLVQGLGVSMLESWS
jgi:hypothetical protein